MLQYELSQILNVIGPYLAGAIGGAICVVIGIIISNIFWKARIHRYAKTEIVETLEYQKNKIDQLESEIREKKSLISDLKGIIKISKLAALKIMEAIQ